jgi:hypothetical protein
MPVTRAKRATAALWAVVAAVALAGVALTVLARNDLVTGDLVSNLCAAPAAVFYATLGTLIVCRAGNIRRLVPAR